MQLTAFRTKHIIFKAEAFDRYSPINCAIVNIAAIADSLINAHIAANLLKPVTAFSNISFLNSAPDFLHLDTKEHEWMEELLENKIWSFIETTEEELDELVLKQQVRTESGLLIVSSDEKFRFVAYAKYSGIEIATEQFTLEPLGIIT